MTLTRSSTPRPGRRSGRRHPPHRGLGRRRHPRIRRIYLEPPRGAALSHGAHAQGSICSASRLTLAIRLGVTGLFLLFPALVAFGVWRGPAPCSRSASRWRQPIPFKPQAPRGRRRHRLPATTCHTTVETSRHAGLPAPASADALPLAAVHRRGRARALGARAPAAAGRVAWQRVHSAARFRVLRPFVHVARGVACAECHGRIDQMPPPGARSRCRCSGPRLHRATRRPTCTARGRVPQPAPAAFRRGKAAARAAPGEPPALTDCSTCHR